LNGPAAAGFQRGHGAIPERRFQGRLGREGVDPQLHIGERIQSAEPDPVDDFGPRPLLWLLR
jgi:hypothetical protein